MTDAGNTLENSFVESVGNEFTYGDIDVSGTTTSTKKSTTLRTADGNLAIDDAAAAVQAEKTPKEPQEKQKSVSAAPQANEKKITQNPAVQKNENNIKTFVQPEKKNTAQAPKQQNAANTSQPSPQKQQPVTPQVQASKQPQQTAPVKAELPKEQKPQVAYKGELQPEQIQELSSIISSTVEKNIKLFFEIGMKEIDSKINNILEKVNDYNITAQEQDKKVDALSKKTEEISAGLMTAQDKSHSDIMLIKDVINKDMNQIMSQIDMKSGGDPKSIEMMDRVTDSVNHVSKNLDKMDEKQNRQHKEIVAMIKDAQSEEGFLDTLRETIETASQKVEEPVKTEDTKEYIEMKNKYEKEIENYEKARSAVENLAKQLGDKDDAIKKLEEDLRTSKDELSNLMKEHQELKRINEDNRNIDPLPYANGYQNDARSDRYDDRDRYYRNSPANIHISPADEARDYPRDPYDRQRGSGDYRNSPDNQRPYDDRYRNMGGYDYMDDRRQNNPQDQRRVQNEYNNLEEGLDFAPSHVAKPVEKKRKKFLGIF